MAEVVRHVNDEERRARLARRHALSAPVHSVEEAVTSVVCLHATEPPSVYLSVQARSGASRADVGRALYEDRTVVKQLAMRRTLFAFPTSLLPATWGSASVRVTEQISTRLAKEVESNGLAENGSAWVTRASNAVLRSLREEGPATTTELRTRIPTLSQRLERSPGKKYGGHFPVAPQLLTVLAASGRVVRGDNAGDWKLSRPRWTPTDEWLDDVPSALDAAGGYRVLVEHWLRRFGPGTEDDVVWWLGATKSAVRRALTDLDAAPVELAGGEVGYLMPDDLDEVTDPGPWAALLPVLDPTTMGWKQRGFYLDPDDVPYLFDTNGNGGTTAWWHGRVVGCWVQDDDGAVQVVLRHDVGAEAQRALDAEARRLSAWLAGQRVSTVYSSLQMKHARLP